MKCNMSQMFKKNKKGQLKPTWRYYLGRFIFGSLEGIDDSFPVKISKRSK